MVGRNGCGKSTLLKILADKCCGSSISSNEGFILPSYEGKIESARDCRIVFVEQEPPTPSDVTVGDALLGVLSLSTAASSTQSVYDAVRNYRIAALKANDDPDGFATASATMDASDGWAVLTKADEVATRLRVKHLEDMPLSNLSGGERKRVALAGALVREPDVLLLDEPTNHLDLAAIRWLSDLITEQRKLTLLTVTHDRAFLEEVCNSILELDRGSLYAYSGNYADYLRGKEERLVLEDAAYAAAKNKYKVELDWMRRQPQARESKSKARIDAFYKLEKATKPRPLDPTLDLDKDGQRRIGKNILKMKNVSLSFENRKMLDAFSYDFNQGDKIGIVGANGVGKSTFIRVLIGTQPIDDGLIETGETVVFGVYDQMGIQIDDDQRVLDYVKERVEARDGSSLAEAPQEAMKLLKQFQFQRDRWNERVSMLSGGERRRLQLLSVLTKRPNFLILDEPTNDIDLDTLTALESYLDEFSGVLVIVSHDRFFTDKVTKHLFIFEGNGVVKDYPGSLSDYAECLIEQENSTGGTSASVPSSNIDKQSQYKDDRKQRLERRNNLKKWKREMSKLEPEMEDLKTKAEATQIKIDNSQDEGWTVLAELTDKLQQINDEIEEKELRWLELAEMAEEAEEDDS